LHRVGRLSLKNRLAKKRALKEKGGRRKKTETHKQERGKRYVFTIRKV